MIQVIALILLSQCGRAGEQCRGVRAGGREGMSGAPASLILEQVPLAVADQCTGVRPSINGVPLTVTRASQAYCAKSDGTFVLVDNNVPRVGRMGLLKEQASTQLLASPRDLTAAVWVKTNMTCVRTTGADGVASSGSRCTATADNATVIQSYDAGIDMRSFGASVSRVTGGGTVSAVIDGVTFCGITSPLIVAAQNGVSWLRLHTYGDDHRDTAAISHYGCGAFTAYSHQYDVGFKINTSGDVIDVDFTQLEPSFWQTSPIVGTSRATETLTAPASGWPSSGYFQAIMTTQRAPLGESWFTQGLLDTGGVRLTATDYVTTPTSMTAAGRIGGNTDVSVVLTGGVLGTYPTPDFPMMRPRMWRLAWSTGDTRLGLQGRTWATGTSAVLPTNGVVYLGGLSDSTLPFQGWIAFPKVGTAIAEAHVRVATIGDSIMDGSANVRIGEALQTNLGWSGYLVQPMALGGTRLDSAVPPEISCTDRYHEIEGNVDVIVFDCGNNDLFRGATSEDTWDAGSRLLSEMILDGKKVAPFTIGPCAGYSSCTSAGNEYWNSHLATWCTAQGANCSLVESAAYLQDPDNHSLMRAACNKNTLNSTGDYVHPGDVCSLGMSSLAATAVRILQ